MIGYFNKAQKIVDAQDELGQVWISGEKFAKNVQEIKETKITVVCCCMATEIRYKPEDNISQARFPIDDTLDCDIKAYFQPTFEVIEAGRKTGNVLVHSESGISRCGIIMIGYLIKKYGWSYKKSLEILREVRPCIQPNENFEKQAKWYEKFSKPL